MQRFLVGLFAVAYFTAPTLLLAQGAVTITAAPATAAPAADQSSTTERTYIVRLMTQLEAGFAGADAKAIADCWTENGEFVGPGGARSDGRVAIEKLFTEAFATRKGGKLSIHVLHVRFVNDSVAMVDAVTELKANGGQATEAAPPRAVSLVLVKQSRRWLIESARENSGGAPLQTSRLKELEWLLGDWASEASPQGISLHTSCDWTANQAFLIRKFKVEGKGALLHGGTEIIGWDPRTNRIRSWIFDADGGFGENIWVRDGDRWIIKYSGTLADGNEASATHIIAKVDAGTLSMQSKDRYVNGEHQPDVPETTIKRQVVEKPAAKVESGAKAP